MPPSAAIAAASGALLADAEADSVTVAPLLLDADTDEPLLTEDRSRHVLFPVTDNDAYLMYKKAQASYWVPDEINFAQDRTDLERMAAPELTFVTHVLAFFAASDGIVMENLASRFMNDVKLPEARHFYAAQLAIEAIHSETYSLLIDTYVRDAAQKARLFDAVSHFPAIREKAQWAMRWIESREASFAHRLLGFAIVEGLFFSASFCAIFWLRKRGLLPGLGFANALISRDEGLHTDFACLLYGKLRRRLPEAAAHAMMAEAVDIERRFITESIPCSMINMNICHMTEYIEYVADRLLQQLGYTKKYHAKNPFDFMELASTEGKDNFFEKRVSTYNKAGVSFMPGVSTRPDQLAVDLDADF